MPAFSVGSGSPNVEEMGCWSITAHAQVPDTQCSLWLEDDAE